MLTQTPGTDAQDESPEWNIPAYLTWDVTRYDHTVTAESREREGEEFSSSDDTRETEDAIQSNAAAGKQENRQIWCRDEAQRLDEGHRSSVFVDGAFVWIALERLENTKSGKK